MTMKFHHIHLKAKDPDKTAAWYVSALGFSIVERIVRPSGDIFINCKTADGAGVVISGEKTGEKLPEGTSALHMGLEHFAVHTEDFEGDLAKLKANGAMVLADTVTTPTGLKFTFIAAPDNVRIELMCFPRG